MRGEIINVSFDGVSCWRSRSIAPTSESSPVHGIQSRWQAEEMADFCGAWRGRGDPMTRRGVLGDFLQHYEEVVEPLVAPGKSLRLGICEGHGTAVIVVVDDEGEDGPHEAPGAHGDEGKHVQVWDQLFSLRGYGMTLIVFSVPAASCVVRLNR